MANFSSVYQRYMLATNQLIPDEQVGFLPWPERYTFYKERWHEHGKSYMRLGDRIRTMPGHLRILDLGCGNGWMSGRLAQMEKAEIWGVDIADFQLQQAERVYGGKPNLHFLKADIFNDPLPNSQFDLILVADSAQFFPEIGLLISQLQEMLAHNGRIHLTGSDFWLMDEIEKEREKMWGGFTELGVPQMQGFYHFHSVEQLTVLGANCLYDARPQAGGIRNMFLRGNRLRHYWWSIGGA